ncbi:MAG: TonB-dependent receptor [Verrucomicrobiota bacterium]
MNPLRFLLTLLALALCVTAGRSQSRDTGAIRGTISNAATRANLHGATVRVVGTDQVAFTESDGTFLLNGVASGSQRLAVEYTGLDGQTVDVTVRPAATATADVSLNSTVYKMDQFVVATEREGEAFAINEQRRASNIKNVVSSDTFGNTAEANVGDFLKNLPGVSIEYQAGDPRAFSLRGVDSTLTAVTMDGNRYANAASSTDNRRVELEQLSIQNIETIEVTKAPTPAQEADALGGSVNLITKNAFSQKGRRIRLDLNLSTNTEFFTFDKTPGWKREPMRKIYPGFSLYYSNAFGKKNPIGVAVTLRHSVAQKWVPRQNQTYQYPNAAGVAPSPTLPTYARVLQLFEFQQAQQRSGATVNLDYKLSDSTTVYVYNQYTYFDGHDFIRDASFTAAAVAPGFSTEGVTATNGSISVGSDNTRKFGDTYNINPGAKHRFGPWRIDYDGYYSYSINHYDDPAANWRSTTYTLTGISYRLENTGGTQPVKLTQLTGPSYLDLNNYGALTQSTDRRYGTDSFLGGKANVRRDFATTWPLTLQAGTRYRKQERYTRNRNQTYTYVGPDGIAGNADDRTLGRFADPVFGNSQAYGFPVANWTSNYLLGDAFVATPQAFSENLITTVRNATTPRNVTEEITSGYFQGTMSVKRLNILAGVRYEETELEGSGRVIRPNAGASIVDPIEREIERYRLRETRTNSYDNFFPNVQLKYDLTRQLVLRASYTTNIGRPNFNNIIPGTTINDTARSITENNAKLLPQRGKSYDLSAEYYLEPVGMFSLGLFRKDIVDYISRFSELVESGPDNGFDGEYAGYTVSTTRNQGSARIQGMEASYSQQLRRLPGLLSKLSVFANGTWIQTEGNYGGAATVRELVNFVPRTWNAGLSWRGDKFSTSVKYNVRSRFLVSRNATTGEEIRQQENARLDLGMTYRLTKRFTVYADATNALSEPEVWESVVPGRVQRYGELAAAMNFGLRADF